MIQLPWGQDSTIIKVSQLLPNPTIARHYKTKNFLSIVNVVHIVL